MMMRVWRGWVSDFGGRIPLIAWYAISSVLHVRVRVPSVCVDEIVVGFVLVDSSDSFSRHCFLFRRRGWIILLLAEITEIIHCYFLLQLLPSLCSPLDFFLDHAFDRWQPPRPLPIYTGNDIH